MNTRVYHVTHQRTGKARLIRAVSQAQAIRYAANTEFAIRVASQDDIIRWRKRGMTYAAEAQQMHVSKTIAENRLRDILARNPGILDKDTSSGANVAQPRRVINSTTTDIYVPDMPAPARPGAMDYKAIKSVGI